MKLQIEFSVASEKTYYVFEAKSEGYIVRHRHPKLAVDKMGFAKFKSLEYSKLASMLVEHVASL